MEDAEKATTQTSLEAETPAEEAVLEASEPSFNEEEATRLEKESNETIPPPEEDPKGSDINEDFVNQPPETVEENEVSEDQGDPKEDDRDK